MSELETIDESINWKDENTVVLTTTKKGDIKDANTGKIKKGHTKTVILDEEIKLEELEDAEEQTSFMHKNLLQQKRELQDQLEKNKVDLNQRQRILKKDLQKINEYKQQESDRDRLQRLKKEEAKANNVLELINRAKEKRAEQFGEE